MSSPILYRIITLTYILLKQWVEATKNNERSHRNEKPQYFTSSFLNNNFYYKLYL